MPFFLVLRRFEEVEARSGSLIGEFAREREVKIWRKENCKLGCSPRQNRRLKVSRRSLFCSSGYTGEGEAWERNKCATYGLRGDKGVAVGRRFGGGTRRRVELVFVFLRTERDQVVNIIAIPRNLGRSHLQQRIDRRREIPLLRIQDQRSQIGVEVGEDLGEGLSDGETKSEGRSQQRFDRRDDGKEDDSQACVPVAKEVERKGGRRRGRIGQLDLRGVRRRKRQRT